MLEWMNCFRWLWPWSRKCVPPVSTLPPLPPVLSMAEYEALQEVAPLAEDLAMRGCQRSAVALEWARDLIEKHRQRQSREAVGTT